MNALPWYAPTRRPFQWALLLMLSLLTFGPYYAADTIAAIETFLISGLGVSREAIGVMVALYNVAAIFTVVAAGLVIDRVGAAQAGLLFAGLTALGTGLIAVKPELWTIYVGRFLLGAGSESLLVVQNVMLARWFARRELALAFGVTLTCSRLGSLFTFNSAPLLAQRHGYRSALWLAAATCFLSLLAAAGSAGLSRLGYALGRRGVISIEEPAKEGPLRLLDLRRFPGSYWLVTLLCVTFYSAVFPFQSLAPDFFHERDHLPMAVAGQEGLLRGILFNLLHPLATAPGTAGVITLASLFLAPVAGTVFDRLERRPGRHRGGTMLLIVGSGLLIPAYLLLAFTHIAPAQPLALLGAAFVLAPAALWPLIPHLVPAERQGTAFGVMTMMQNLGLTLFTWLNARLREATRDYTASMVMFALLGAVGLLLALQLYRRRA